MTPAVRAFNAERPEVTVEVQRLEWDDQEELILSGRVDGSLTDSKAPWGGFLHIAGNFSYCDALVQTVSIPYTVSVNCIVFSRTVPEAFDDLDTSADGYFPRTNEQAKKVTGDFSDPIKRAEWKWQFLAAGL